MSKKVTTIKDIAERLSISIATVSRALRGSSDIKRETKLAVMEMAKEMDYHPNLLASSLSSKKSKILGVVVPTINRQFWSNSISGIENVAYDKGYKVMIFQSAESFQKEVEIVETLANSRVDGILLALSKETNTYNHIQSIMNRGIPVLLFERVCSEINSSKVITDDFNGSKEVVQHLIDRGKRKIAYLSGPMSLGVCEDRLNGFKEAHKDNDLHFDQNLILEISDFTFEAAENALIKLWEMEDKPDALFCFADILAIGALKASKKLGIRVPEDLAIAGFGNDDICRFVTPSLTTMSQPSFEMGQLAANLILEEINSEDEEHQPHHRTIKPVLVIREST
ncbi:LacI family DNA-binding transcriptional regulator [Algoriphagus aquimarinus]|uniref:Transcriptional regulator, LacI family n=1 Tax=Algoriphagus aquimarinus TaxID=237018 RepID=A0A1I1CE74_9BACT|nr:LacI family DNA-binding transcriptional regulator [Algoriphagus aquimarinus]SFB60874.1 transcriptional regulator, LacI family [Algoriphagus aquimarinus]